MYKKDLLTAEIQKLSQVLARILGLKLEGKLAEAENLFNETMENSFTLQQEMLSNNNLVLFEKWLSENELPAEKLDALSEFLYYELGLNKDRNQLIAPKLNLIYTTLANKHKTVHLVNLHRQKIIQQYL